MPPPNCCCALVDSNPSPYLHAATEKSDCHANLAAAAPKASFQVRRGWTERISGGTRQNNGTMGGTKAVYEEKRALEEFANGTESGSTALQCYA